MPSIQDILAIMRRNPKGVSFGDLCKGTTISLVWPDSPAAATGSTTPTQGGGKTPWPGDPRVNIQNDKGMAKAYQVKQVLKAIERLTAPDGDVEVQDNATK